MRNFYLGFIFSKNIRLPFRPAWWDIHLSKTQHVSAYLPLSWSDRCLGPPCIWVRCGRRETRPGSGTGFCFWHLAPSVSGGKGTTQWKKVSSPLNPSCIIALWTLLIFYIWGLSKHCYNWAPPTHTEANNMCLMTRAEVGSPLLWSEKKPPVTRLWHHQEVETVRAGGACVTWYSKDPIK